MSVFKPEFVEVEIAPRIEGTCAWCGATIRYPGDETSAECAKCGAQSARAIQPKRSEPPRRVQQQADMPAVIAEASRQVRGSIDLGPIAAAIIYVVIPAAIAFPFVVIWWVTR
jgi:hypothetical protein